MLVVAAPPAPKSSILDLAHSRQQRHQEEQQRRRDAALDAERARMEQSQQLQNLHYQRSDEVSRGRAKAYLNDFLQRSEWGNRMNQFAVVWDAVPTMEELEGYGELDKTEGTRACRKLFKAVVVWDELGCSLWERLRVTSEQKKAALKGLGPMLRMGGTASSSAAITTAPVPKWRVDDDVASPEIKGVSEQTTQRSDSRSSSRSRMRAASHQSLRKLRNKHSKATLPPSPEAVDDMPELPFQEESSATEHYSYHSSNHSSNHSSYSHNTYSNTYSTYSPAIPELPQTEQQHQQQHQQQQPQQDRGRQRAQTEPRPGLPRLFSHTCATAVRRRFGVFGEHAASRPGS